MWKGMKSFFIIVGEKDAQILKIIAKHCEHP